MASEKLAVTHFRCPKCDTWKRIEARGEVVNGPLCSNCRKPMRKVNIVQTNLGLFKTNAE